MRSCWIDGHGRAVISLITAALANWTTGRRPPGLSARGARHMVRLDCEMGKHLVAHGDIERFWFEGKFLDRRLDGLHISARPDPIPTGLDLGPADVEGHDLGLRGPRRQPGSR
jgi:hypothetical protein